MTVREQVPRLSYHELHPNGYSLMYEIDDVLLWTKTEYQELAIVETRGFGRALFLDGLIQSAECDEAIYHESLVHPGMIVHGNAKRVLIGGAGEGSTLREVLRHPDVEEVLCVDLDGQVVEACKKWLPRWHEGSFDDPRVTLRYEDVVETLDANQVADAAAGWDVIIMDVTEPIEGGPAAALFSTEFFAKVSGALADDGIVIVQGGEVEPLNLANIKWALGIMRSAFASVELVTTYVPSFFSAWGTIVCAKRPLEVEPTDLEARIARLPTETLQFYDAVRHRALLRTPPLFARRL